MNDTEHTTPAENAQTQPFDRTQPLDGPRISGPRIRWGAIVWGTITAAFAVVVLVIAGAPYTREAFADWLWGLGAGGFVVIGLVALGAIILIAALLSVIRRAQAGRGASASQR